GFRSGVVGSNFFKKPGRHRPLTRGKSRSTNISVKCLGCLLALCMAACIDPSRGDGTGGSNGSGGVPQTGGTIGTGGTHTGGSNGTGGNNSTGGSTGTGGNTGGTLGTGGSTGGQ